MYALVPDCLLLQPFFPGVYFWQKSGREALPGKYFAGLFQNDKDSVYFDNRLLGVGSVLFLCLRTD